MKLQRVVYSKRLTGTAAEILTPQHEMAKLHSKFMQCLKTYSFLPQNYMNYEKLNNKMSLYLECVYLECRYIFQNEHKNMLTLLRLF